MSQGVGRAVGTPSGASGWDERYSALRPRLRDRRFWMIQGLVATVAVFHYMVENYRIQSGIYNFEFVPMTLFFIPVVVAAIGFGFVGSLATAILCLLVSVPNMIWMHDGIEVFVEISQITIVMAVAVFVGKRVDREKEARLEAESTSAALKSSETRFRGLFESAPVAILVLDADGAVLDANPTAGVLFRATSDSLRSRPIADLLGQENAAQVTLLAAGNRSSEPHIVLRYRNEPEIILEPTVTRIGEPQTRPAAQLLLRDVTEERQRQAGLRAYAAHMLRAQEDERKRIAQELHDDIVQEVVLLCRLLDDVEASGPPLAPSTSEGLGRARHSAEGIVQGLRDFVKAVRPPTLEDLGLVTSIRRLLFDLMERTGVEGEFNSDGGGERLLPDTELGLFRMTQEALRNVERHAEAAHVAVSISFDDNRVRLEVVDNGKGFAVPPGLSNFGSSGRLGLIGMQERADLLGGQVDVQSAPDHGTRVTIQIPISRDTELAAT